MVEKSQDKEMDKSVAVGNVENNSEKIYFALFMCRNPIQKEFLKSHNGLFSHQLTSTGRSANRAAFFGACLVSPQKAIVQFQKFFFY